MTEKKLIVVQALTKKHEFACPYCGKEFDEFEDAEKCRDECWEAEK